MTFRVRTSFQQMLPQVDGVPPGHHIAELPVDVLDWLADLLLLRGVPLAYIVPDPRLLPPESIRFFHVDPTWTARLFDGALAAASFGSFDVGVHAPIVRALRKRAEIHLATRLFDDHENASLITLPMLCGFLMRSEIVRRWPGLIVSAWEDTQKKDPLVIARKDRLAAGLLIVIIAGVPSRLEITEPHEGTRFGAEFEAGAWSVQVRDRSGAFVFKSNQDPVTAAVKLRPPDGGVDRRVLEIAALAQEAAARIADKGAPKNPPQPPPPPLGSAHLSLCLQQQPYSQVFQGSGAPERKRVRRVRDRLIELAKKAKTPGG